MFAACMLLGSLGDLVCARGMLIVVVTRRTVNALGYAGAEEMVLYTPS